MSVIKEGEFGLRQDLLIYGNDYHLWRNGKYIDIFTLKLNKMAAIDKIYGTQKQYNEFKKWVLENQKPIKIAYDYDIVTINGVIRKRNITYKYVLPSNYLYPRNGYNKDERPISNFPEKIDKWILKHCKIEWVISRIKEQYGL